MHSEGYSTWSACLCVCVCLSTSHFSRVCSCHKRYQPSRRWTKVENFKRFSLKMLCCKARVFPVGMAYGYMISRPFFTLWKTRMRMNLDHVASGRFVLGRDVHCEFDYWPLAVSMPPTKVCPQCKAAVPVRRKTCECCDHVL